MENENNKLENRIQSTINDDDDEEEDEDYDPTNDPEAKHEDEDSVMEDVDTYKNDFALSANQNKAVEEAYTSLFDTDYDTNKNINATAAEVHNLSTTKNNNKPSKKSQKKEIKRIKKAYKKKYKILSDLFGSKVATKMLLRNNEHNLKHKLSSTTNESIITKLERKVITETKSFAGQEISVKKVVMEPVTISNTTLLSNTTTNLQPQSTNSNLDTIISNITNPKNKLSTIEKSNVDWETFKETQNLNEEFEKRANEGNDSFLNRKEFLQRVDLRRFEQEKEERERKRVANS